MSVLLEKQSIEEVAETIGVAISDVEAWRAQYLRAVAASFKSAKPSALTAMRRRPVLAAGVVLTVAFGLFSSARLISQEVTCADTTTEGLAVGKIKALLELPVKSSFICITSIFSTVNRNGE